MKALGISHVGITVSDFGKAVRFYWDVFGCPLIAVTEMPPDRVRAFFGIAGESPRCTVGWIQLPGGSVLELFAFEPKEPKAALRWNSPGFTHLSLHVRNLDRWYAHLTKHGVQCLTKPTKTPAGHSFFYARDSDGTLIELIDLGSRRLMLYWFGGLIGRLRRRGRFRDYYDEPVS
jgi:catechol 2,3-dioxygenase-like lactoylglutathione lyase family enzyme